VDLPYKTGKSFGEEEVMCRVVNLHHKRYDVYIGRAGKGEEGLLGNPIRKGERCFVCGKTHTKAGDTVPCFRTWFYSSDPEAKKLRARVQSKINVGMSLGCFCKDKDGNGACHGDVYAEFVNNGYMATEYTPYLQRQTVSREVRYAVAVSDNVKLGDVVGFTDGPFKKLDSALEVMPSLMDSPHAYIVRCNSDGTNTFMYRWDMNKAAWVLLLKLPRRTKRSKK
jgi:hypothetical protein